MFGSDTRNILRLIETLMSMFPDGSRFRFDGWRSKVKSVVRPVEKSLGPRRLHFNLGPLAKAMDLSNLGLERGPSIEWASYRSVWSLEKKASKERGWFFFFFFIYFINWTILHSLTHLVQKLKNLSIHMAQKLAHKWN